MKLPNSGLLDKKIPTLIGLLILVGGLVVGVFFISTGPGVFAPRAAPGEEPTKIRISNITDTGFTVSFLTDAVTSGFVKYGKQANALKNQASDDRDQLTGKVGTYTTHHITVAGLESNTLYYFVIGTGSGTVFGDPSGNPYTVETGAKISTAPPQALTIYGDVLTNASTPAEGSLVYVSLEGAGEVSALVKSSGRWAIPLSHARTPDGKQYAQPEASAPLYIFAQGKKPTDTAQLVTTVREAQPTDTLVFGQSQTDTETMTQAETSTPPPPTSTPTPYPTPTSDLTTGVGGSNFEASNITTPDSREQQTINENQTLLAQTQTSGTEMTPTYSASQSATPTPIATVSARTTIPATSSAQPTSGSSTITILLTALGTFLICIGSSLYIYKIKIYA